jgi:hypothetical protein
MRCLLLAEELQRDRHGSADFDRQGCAGRPDSTWGASLELALNRLAADQYDQIIRTDSNRLQDTTIAGTGSKR